MFGITQYYLQSTLYRLQTSYRPSLCQIIFSATTWNVQFLLLGLGGITNCIKHVQMFTSLNENWLDRGFGLAAVANKGMDCRLMLSSLHQILTFGSHCQYIPAEGSCPFYNQSAQKLAVCSHLLSCMPGVSMFPGRLGRNALSSSLSFFPLNLLYECSRP